MALPYGSIAYDYDVRGNVIYERSIASVACVISFTTQNKVYRELGPRDPVGEAPHLDQDSAGPA